eukprot:1787937-Pyramimonas_sp.AAC.1
MLQDATGCYMAHGEDAICSQRTFISMRPILMVTAFLLPSATATTSAVLFPNRPTCTAGHGSIGGQYGVQRGSRGSPEGIYRSSLDA